MVAPPTPKPPVQKQVITSTLAFRLMNPELYVGYNKWIAGGRVGTSYQVDETASTVRINNLTPPKSDNPVATVRGCMVTRQAPADDSSIEVWSSKKQSYI